MTDLNIPDYASVDECHSSNYGENLFYQNIIEASELGPQPFGVPWVTFDGIWIDRLIITWTSKKFSAPSS